MANLTEGLDPRHILRDRRMTARQWLVVGFCVAINFLDGYDIVALVVAAPVLGPAWQLSPGVLGFLFSAGLAGMMVGALLISPCADIWGRRRAIIGALVLMTAGMALSAVASDATTLAIARIVTGVGMGGMTSTAGTLAMEYSSANRRELSVGLVVIGYPVGSVIGSALAIWLLQIASWRAIFAAGALATALLLPVIIWRLPESLDFLLGRQPRGALANANRVLAWLDIPRLDRLPDIGPAGPGLRPLLATAMLRRLARVCSGQAMNMCAWYFIFNWATKWVAEMGLSTSASVSMSMSLSIGGVVGGVAAGLLASVLGLRTVTTGSLAGVALSIAIFPHMPPDMIALTLLGLFLGAMLFASASSIYSTIALAFPPELRATGVGIASTAGRLGAVIGPLGAGLMLEAGVTKAMICIILAVPALLSAAIFWATPRAEVAG